MTEIELITANGRTIRPFVDPYVDPYPEDYKGPRQGVLDEDGMMHEGIIRAEDSKDTQKSCSCDYDTVGAHALSCELHKPVYRVPHWNMERPHDMVEHPPHYNQGGLEAADIIEAFKLPYHLGTVAKYVLRCQYKGEMLEDLRKAAWHLNRQIELEEKNA